MFEISGGRISPSSSLLSWPRPRSGRGIKVSRNVLLLWLNIKLSQQQTQVLSYYFAWLTWAGFSMSSVNQNCCCCWESTWLVWKLYHLSLGSRGVLPSLDLIVVFTPRYWQAIVTCCYKFPSHVQVQTLKVAPYLVILPGGAPSALRPLGSDSRRNPDMTRHFQA